jgi:hypothetical protein
MKNEISRSRVNAYRRQIAEQEDKNVPWDIALDIVCDTVIEQGKEIAKLRTVLDRIANGQAKESVCREWAKKALQTPSGAGKVA